MSGWIKMYRQILDNPVVCKDSDHLAVWTYLLLNATHKEYPAIFGKEKIMLKCGQLITGRKTISEKFKIDESKVQRILKLLENEQQIEQQTGNKNRLITVLNWHLYQEVEQQDEQQVNNKCTTNEQQVNTNKNVRTKELKNDKKKDKEPKETYAEFVTLTIQEYEKLILKHGEVDTKRLIEILDNYKGSKKKKYESDYRAILSWVEDRLAEEKLRKGVGNIVGAANREVAATDDKYARYDFGF
jgi:hypothetical protein